MRARRLALAFVVGGCQFQSVSDGSTAGLGQAEATASTGDSPSLESSSGSAEGPGVEATGGPDDAGASTTGSFDETTTGPSEESTGAAESSGGPQVDCALPQTFVLPVSEAEVMPPMTLSNSGGETHASSPEANTGSVRFSFDVACAGTYRVYGRVFDAQPYVNDNDPDSYHVAWNGSEVTWFYGCQTEGFPNNQWSLLQVRTGIQGANCSDTVELRLELEVGPDEITLINREAAAPNGAVAMISSLVVTNDPEFGS